MERTMESPLDQPTAGVAEHEADADDAVLTEPKLIETELIVEEISIDGMCGVY